MLLGVKYLQSILKTKHQLEHIDGVVGFSQGGSMGAFLTSKESEGLFNGWKPKFAVLISAYENPAIEQSFCGTIPSYHVWGAKDQIISPEDSLKLARKMNPLEANHMLVIKDSGHAVPSANEEFATKVS